MFEYRLDNFYSLPAIPPGVLLFLAFVPLFWLTPVRWIRAALILSSIALALICWPPSYCLTLAAAVMYGWLVVWVCRSLTAPPAPDATAGSATGSTNQSLIAFAWIAVHAWYVPALIWPALRWLPYELPYEPVIDVAKFGGEARIYYWVAWLGLAYTGIRSLHVAVDVCRGTITRIRFTDYLAFILFPLALRMGPIMRYQDFATQIDSWRDRITLRNVGIGLGRILLGLARIGLMVYLFDNVAQHGIWKTPEQLGRLVVFANLALLPFTLYLWISGYIDIAVGLGRMIGFVLPENFRYPFRSTSIREFWKRWHITMGAWFFDYIYIPLGGNRRHVFLNYLATFGYCALWHGLFRSYYAWAISQAVGIYVNRSWHQYWTDQRDRHTPLYTTLRRYRLVGGWLSFILSWALTITYQLMTIALFMDEGYSGRRCFGYLLGLYP
ncbi:MAG: MBOAT family protein [Phycisphaerae bacterium]|nr:MBOAT family protein [Phycisphaerae bacterium]